MTDLAHDYLDLDGMFSAEEAQTENPRDLSTLRGIVTMGAPLEREACLRYQEVLTPRIFNGYGTTETFWNTFLRPSDAWCACSPTGRPGPTSRSPRTVPRSAR